MMQTRSHLWQARDKREVPPHLGSWPTTRSARSHARDELKPAKFGSALFKSRPHEC
jgi:hypothetical protein